MKTKDSRTYLLGVLIMLVHALPFSLFSQSNLAFEDNFSRPHLWEEIYLIPLNSSTGQLLTSDGDIHIDGGEVVYDDCGNQSDKRVYRKMGRPVGQYWTLDVDFTPTAGGPHGVAHIIAGLTAGTANPYNIVPDTVSSSSPTFAPTNQDGIFLEYMSPLYGDTSDYYLRVRSKDSTTYHTPVSCGYILPNGQTYYLRLYMANGSLTFQRFNDAERTDLEDDYALTVPSTVTGLNVIQHSNIPQGSYDRKLTATVDNVKLYDSSMPCIRCGDYTLFTTTTLTDNYVISKTARKAFPSALALDTMSNTADAWAEVAYVDGLGRPLQEVSLGAAPDCQGDMVQYHQYDTLGREAIVDLPYVASGINGSFRVDGSGRLPMPAQDSFYSAANFPHIPSGDLAVPFAETVFEASPLNRVLEQGAPGADWQVGSGHTVQTNIRPNTAADDVFFFGLDPQPGSTYNNEYDPDELIRTETTDENGTYSLTFTDKLGRTILVQQEIGGADIRTYYMYDNWGRVKYVLQPQGVEEFQANSTNGYGNAYVLSQALIDDFAFQYVYDGRGRVIEKRVPGADWLHLVYNKLDQVVLTQDGNQRNNTGTNDWSFTKYDAQARPIMTGIFASNDNRATLQAALDLETVLFEERDGSNFSAQQGYSNLAYPRGNLSLHSVTYYDDYDYDRDGNTDVSYQADTDNFPDHEINSFTRGMITGVRIWILNPDSDMPDNMLTSTFYDKYGREVQTIADNHLKGSDISWYEYDFAGQLLFSKAQHIGHDGSGSYGAYERSATVYKSFTYGPRGRLIRTEQKTEDPENAGHETEFVTLSEQRYDKLGQMSRKNLHYKAGNNFLQLGDYQYNIRGWLTQINEPSTTVPSGSYRDLFAMKLHYNSGASNIVSGTDDQYNGNISAMQWQVLGEESDIRAYAFDYDNQNRLTEALYRENSGSGWNTVSASYDLVNIGYDKSGNITELLRMGKTGASTFGLMDGLSYTYSGNRLMKVDDSGLKTYLTDVQQFEDGNTFGDDYAYDHNGNLTQDLNKGISSISYNHLNKPTSVVPGIAKNLAYIYSADGTKLRQNVEEPIFGMPGLNPIKTTDYAGGFHYEDADGVNSGPKKLLFFAHEEGRVRIDNGEPIYEMYLQDHLGNNRIMFVDENEDGWVDPDPVNGEVLQETHFYPFGLTMADASSTTTPAVPNNYLYTGKEYQNEYGIGWIDFGARMYDASMGRWNGVDIQAERYSSISPYAYVANNPVILVDPNGEEIWISYLNAEGYSQEVRYENGKVYDAKGNEINWTDHHNDFLKNTVASLSIIRYLGGNVGEKLISSAEKSDLKVIIQIASGEDIEHEGKYNEDGKFVGGTIGYNPEIGLVVDEEGSIQAPIMNLVDELGHFMDSHDFTFEEHMAEKNKKDIFFRNVFYGNEVERRNTEKYVNPIARALGNPIYEHHFGVPIKVKGGLWSQTPSHEINRKEAVYYIKKDLKNAKQITKIMRAKGWHKAI